MLIESFSLTVAGCKCEYCLGAVRLVPFEIVAPLVRNANRDGVTIRSTDYTFAIDGVRGVACVRMIRRRLARLCGCWIHPGYRCLGHGEAFVRARIAFVEHHTGARAIDTYAFNKPLFTRLGFEERASYKIGTTLLRKCIAR